MSANVDKVLAALDAGLQSSEERGYPERVDHPDLCARCLLHEHAPDAELCASCRAYLLGDSDVDPITRDRHGDFMQTLIDSLNRPVEAGARAATRAAMTFVNVPGAPIRVQRLDREGWPTGEPESLEGYVVHHVDGDPRNNSIDNLRLMPARENASIQWTSRDNMENGASLPAAYRVSSTIEVPAWYAVTCIHCRQVWACDPQRTMDAMGIIRANGCGEQGTCAGAGGELGRDYYVDGHGDVHTRVGERRDWLAETLTWLRQIVSDARGRLGL